MSGVVIDSSVIIAVLKCEPGASDNHLYKALVSTVNLAEVATRLILLGYSKSQTEAVMSELPIKPIAFTEELVNATAFLTQKMKSRGLSLGDRACLATAMTRNLPVLTAHRVWKELEGELGLDIRLIR